MGPRRRRTVVGLVVGALAAAVVASAVLTAQPDRGGGTTPADRPAGPGDPDPAAFPDASSTGVPEGTDLEPYRGPCTVTEPGTVIEAAVVACALVVRTSDVTVRRSVVNGTVEVDGDGYSVTLVDSEVDAGSAYQAAVGYGGLTLLRTEVRGGSVSVLCGVDCLVEDSWLHGQNIPEDADWHLNAYLSNGGHDVVVRRSTLACDAPITAAGGGCTAAASIFGDFSGNARYLFEENLFRASPDQPYCAYAGTDPAKPFGTQVEDVVWRGNVFERGTNRLCGQYGPVTSYDAAAPGNSWEGNVWQDDGTPVLP